MESSDAVVNAIGDLGDRLAGELSEIRWELVQLRDISQQQLEVLKRPRSTEAQELLQQGLRHLINDKLKQAEERFLLALGLDNTDYQVLLNLSVVELRKGDAKQSILYVEDALTLPQNLDVMAKADALWHLARVRYAMQDYPAAFETARQSVVLLSLPRRILQEGVYAILAGRRDGLPLILDAVRREPALFAVAASTPDLLAHRDELLPRLATLIEGVTQELRKRLDALRAATGELRHLAALDSKYLARFDTVFRAFDQLARGEPSYSECREALARLPALEQAPERLKLLNQAQVEFEGCKRAELKATAELERTTTRRLRAVGGPGCLSAVVGFAVIFTVIVIIVNFYFVPLGAESTSPRNLLLFILVVFGLPLFYWGLLQMRTRNLVDSNARAYAQAEQVKSRVSLACRGRDENEKMVRKLFEEFWPIKR